MMLDLPGNETPQQRPEQDSFFVLRSCRELFQIRLEEIIRQSGIVLPSITETFKRVIGDAYDELASSAKQDGFEKTDGLTASRISLVGNDALELDIRIGETINHLKDNEHIDHWRVQLRFMTLLNRPHMASESNPAGLEPIRCGLLALCKESGFDIFQNMEMLDRIEAQLQARLPEVYMEMNNLLEQHCIGPAQVQMFQRSDKRRQGESAAQTSSSLPSNAFSALHQALRQQSSDSTTGEFLPDGFSGSSGGSSGNAVFDASTMVMLNHLIERLNVLEMQQLSKLSDNIPGESTGNAPLQALRAKDLDLPLGKPASIALDTLSLIFEAIFAAPDLPDAVKTAIGRLQIPLLKQALLDPSFFSDSTHPARQLINRMAHAAIGLPIDAGRDHPVCANLGKLADSLRTALDANNASLSPHLEALDILIAEREQQIVGQAQPYIDLVKERDDLEASQSAAQAWMSKTLEETSQPEVRRFLSECWLHVMQTAHIATGPSGKRWTECEAIIKEFLLSLQPKQTPDERKQLLGQIPLLLKRVNAELDRAGISVEKRSPFLDFCFELQSAVLRGRPVPLSTQESVPTPEAAAASNTAEEGAVQILERNGKFVQYLVQPASNPSPWRSTDPCSWKTGDWISFVLPDGEHLCGHLCWQNSQTGTVLLYNNNWGYAVAFAPSIIEQQLRSGQARIASAASLFDEAAERALSQIAAH